MESQSSLSRYTSRRYFNRDDCRWFWPKNAQKGKSKAVELNSFYSGGRLHYSSAADLWRCLSRSRRRWRRRRFATIESSMYKRKRRGYAKFAYQSTRRRRSNRGQSIGVAGRWAVLPQFGEHWRRWHRSDLRQRRTARATTFVSSGVCRRHFSAYFISHLRSSSSTPITRFRCCTLSWPGKQLHYYYF